jgi:mRNA interferase YafQ
MLRADTPLPSHMKDHPLKENWISFRDCHVKPDVVLVYTKKPGQLHLRRIGSHFELFR